MEYQNSELRQLQLVELDILKVIDSLCKEYKIEYFLDSGTALGAKRHRGFIPWDDDIDIGMLRQDYDRFLKIASESLPLGYELCAPGANQGYAPMFAKVMKSGTKFQTRETLESGFEQGIFVDIFPYDIMSCVTKQQRRQIRSCRMWQSVSYLYHSKSITVPHSGVLGVAEKFACRVAHGLIHFFINEQAIIDAYQKALVCEGDSGSQVMAFAYPIGEGYEVEMLLPSVDLEFEGDNYPAPCCIENYLTAMYGKDWNKLPPENKRRNHAPVILDFGE